jgi:bifunctional ADP-heptose synthase (sugar kinase/adenylyltransferase)
VDAVTIFDDETPASLIERLLPDVLVKGADYRVEQIAGARAVLDAGGEVRLIDLEEGRSTSDLIAKVRTAALREAGTTE